MAFSIDFLLETVAEVNVVSRRDGRGSRGRKPGDFGVFDSTVSCQPLGPFSGRVWICIVPFESSDIVSDVKFNPSGEKIGRRGRKVFDDSRFFDSPTSSQQFSYCIPFLEKYGYLLYLLSMRVLTRLYDSKNSSACSLSRV